MGAVLEVFRCRAVFDQVFVPDAQQLVAINALGSFLDASVLYEDILTAQPLVELGVREPTRSELLRVVFLGRF